VSRDDFDIRGALVVYGSLSITANNYSHGLYVGTEITSRTAKKKLRIQDPALREGTRKKLIGKANGL